MTSHYELNEFVKVAPNSLFTQEQIFYVYDFYFNYDILLGQKLLEANQANIDCFYTQKH